MLPLGDQHPAGWLLIWCSPVISSAPASEHRHTGSGGQNRRLPFWANFAKRKPVASNPLPAVPRSFKLTEVFASPSVLEAWRDAGLPQSRTAVENGCLLQPPSDNLAIEEMAAKTAALLVGELPRAPRVRRPSEVMIMPVAESGSDWFLLQDPQVRDRPCCGCPGHHAHAGSAAYAPLPPPATSTPLYATPRHAKPDTTCASLRLNKLLHGCGAWLCPVCALCCWCGVCISACLSAPWLMRMRVLRGCCAGGCCALQELGRAFIQGYYGSAAWLQGYDGRPRATLTTLDQSDPSYQDNLFR